MDKIMPKVFSASGTTGDSGCSPSKNYRTICVHYDISLKLHFIEYR